MKDIAKKTLAICLASVLAVGGLTACSPGSAGDRQASREERAREELGDKAGAPKVGCTGDFSAEWVSTDDSGITIKLTYDRPGGQYGRGTEVLFTSVKLGDKTYGSDDFTMTVDGAADDLHSVSLSVKGDYSEDKKESEVTFSVPGATADDYADFDATFDETNYDYGEGGSTVTTPLKALHLTCKATS